MAKRKQKARLLEQKLSQLYYDPRRPGSYGGVNALHRAIKKTGGSSSQTKRIKRESVQHWLSGQDTYTLHKPVRHHFPRRRIVVGSMDQQWQADLIDVKNLKQQNDGFTFLLTVIDVLSKYAWVIPLKDKTGASLIQAFETIFQERQPMFLQTDKGTEFTNRAFQNFLKQQGVEFFVTQNEDIKAAIAERFNRTLKEKMWRYFTRKNTSRYVDVLPSLVKSYNRSYHRSIKRAPADVDESNQEDVWQTLYGSQSAKPSPRSRPRLKAGDRVRISKARKTFRKGYLGNWSEELFTVSRILKTRPLTYMLKDDNGEELKGSFYHQEIQKVQDKTVFRIERVLDRRRGSGGAVEAKVKWFGYPDTFNSWIPEKHLQTYTG